MAGPLGIAKLLDELPQLTRLGQARALMLLPEVYADGIRKFGVSGMRDGARFERAVDMGFPALSGPAREPSWWHGTESPGWLQFDRPEHHKNRGTGWFMTDNPDMAASYGSRNVLDPRTFFEHSRGYALLNEPDILGQRNTRHFNGPNFRDQYAPEMLVRRPALAPGAHAIVKPRRPGILELVARNWRDDLADIDWKGMHWADGPRPDIYHVRDDLHQALREDAPGVEDGLAGFYDRESAEAAMREMTRERLANGVIAPDDPARFSIVHGMSEDIPDYQTTDEFARAALNDMGAQTALIRNVDDNGPNGFGGEVGNVLIVKRPETVRSVHAVFDPDRKRWENILAGAGGLGVSTGALGALMNRPNADDRVL